MIGGRYSLDRKIGRGGMGSVWLGRDEVLGRPVAMKRVGTMGGGSSPDLMRAEREARIAASLNHPHVVGVFDLVHGDDEQWLVMEYVAGSTLAEMIRTHGALTAEQVAPILAQTAEALLAAHAAGIVHRDVKPSNILVREDGEVKLSDFGIARGEADASLTQTGLVTGSPAYLAPEIASGRPASPASDVWSLGATAFHALSGHPPYAVGDNVLGALYQIVNEPPPRLPQAGSMAPLLEGTMVTDPAGRWTMDEVARFLERAPSPVGGPVNGVPLLPEPPRPADPDLPEPVSLAPEPMAPRARRARPQRGRVLPLAVVFLFVVLVVVLVVLATHGGSDTSDRPDRTPGSGTGARSSTPATPTSSAPTTPAAPAPKAADMRTFVLDYLSEADQDPAQAFERLTPAYQAESQGRAGYLNFWGDVNNVKVVGQVQVDPTTLTATYTYTYVKRHEGKQRDVVHLQLSFDGTTYLIAGAT